MAAFAGNTARWEKQCDAMYNANHRVATVGRSWHNFRDKKAEQKLAQEKLFQEYRAQQEIVEDRIEKERQDRIQSQYEPTTTHLQELFSLYRGVYDEFLETMKVKVQQEEGDDLAVGPASSSQQQQLHDTDNIPMVCHHISTHIGETAVNEIDFVTEQEFKGDYGCDEAKAIRRRIFRLATRMGDIPVMKRIQSLEQKLGRGWVSIESENDEKDYRSPMFDAVYFDQFDALEYLLEIKPENVKACADESKESVIWWAVENENLQIVEKLLEYDASPLSANYLQGGLNCLHLAVIKGNFDLLKLLVMKNVGKQTYCTYNNVTDSHGRTPLHHAARHNNIDAVKFLLDVSLLGEKHVCDPKIKDAEDKTALDIAKEAEHEEVFNELKAVSGGGDCCLAM